MKYANLVIRMFKNALTPKGTEDVSILHLAPAKAFKGPFMERVYKELDDAITAQNIGLDQTTACQALVMNLLADSGDFDTDPQKFQESLDNFLKFEKKQDLH